MNNTIDQLVEKIMALEDELQGEFEEGRRRFHYSIREKRIEFEAEVRRQHQQLRPGIIRFLRESGFVHILVSPFIYIQIIPLLFLDIAVSLFQFVIFPIYGLSKVPRDDFIAIDRHHLAYLNGVQKLNCAYCGYANGLLAYSREIAGRTEAYWCPIKHARRTSGQHRRYFKFADYGDVESYKGRG